MIKKIVCAAIMTALLVSQAVGVLADETATTTDRSVSTTTTYADGQVKVTTTVSGVATDDEITYLAYEETVENEGVTDTNIAYIDQKTVTATNAGTITFDYVTDLKFLGSKVMVGGMDKSASAAFAVDATGSIAANTTVKIGDVAYSVPMVEEVGEELSLTKIKNVEIGGTTLNKGETPVTWFAAADGIWIDSSVLYKETEVTLTWAGTVTTVDNPIVNKVANVGDKLLILGTTTDRTKEYGIRLTTVERSEAMTATDALELVAVKLDENDEEETATLKKNFQKGIAKYNALGCDANGKFVIAIEDIAEVGDTYYVDAFVGDVVSAVSSYEVTTVATDAN